MSIFDQRFSNAEIVAATGVTNTQLQNWMKRGLIIGQSDVEGGGGPGKHRSFSFYNLMEIAVAKALIDAGLSDLQSASKAAAMFAHTGDGPLPGKPGRASGFPFAVPGTKTLIIVGPNRSEEYALTAKDHPLALIAAIKGHGVGAVVIDASEVFERTLHRAGLDPVAAIKEAYGA